MGGSNDDRIVHRQIDVERTEPVTHVAEIVAALEEVPIESLTTTYEHLDHLLSELFSTPPVPEAQVEVSFSYEGYRVSVEQNGAARFLEIA